MKREEWFFFVFFVKYLLVHNECECPCPAHTRGANVGENSISLDTRSRRAEWNPKAVWRQIDAFGLHEPVELEN